MLIMLKGRCRTHFLCSQMFIKILYYTIKHTIYKAFFCDVLHFFFLAFFQSNMLGVGFLHVLGVPLFRRLLYMLL